MYLTYHRFGRRPKRQQSLSVCLKSSLTVWMSIVSLKESAATRLSRTPTWRQQISIWRYALIVQILSSAWPPPSFSTVVAGTGIHSISGWVGGECERSRRLLAEKQMLLSPATLLGIRMTGMSVRSLCMHASLVSWTLTQISQMEVGCGGLEGGYYSHLVKQHCVHVLICGDLSILWLSIYSEVVCGARSLTFTIPGVTAFLSEKLCQDPLEKFFGCQYQRGGVNDNPTVHQFCWNTQASRVVNSVCRDVSGNCRGLKRLKPIDWKKENTPLPKRRKPSPNPLTLCEIMHAFFCGFWWLM